MVNSRDDQGHKDKNLNTSRKILSQEMFMCSIKALIFIIYRICINSNKIGQMPMSKALVQTVLHSLFKMYKQG